MSATSVFTLCDAQIELICSSGAIKAHLKAVLNQDNVALIQLVYELSLHAGLTHDMACQRGLAVYLQNSVIHLADDIADGDCDYLPLPQAVTALYTLQQLSSEAMSVVGLSQIEEIYRLLVRVGVAQHKELDTQQWSLDQSKDAAIELNACQFQAYFMIATQGGRADVDYAQLGHAFGAVTHMANDFATHDARITQLSKPEQHLLRQWSLDQAQVLIDANVPCLNKNLRPLLRHLR